MFIPIIKIIAGFILLILGAEFAIRGAVAIAKRLNIPSLIVGLTVVAFGTSAPELVVSFKAALNNAGGISIGNVVGSNIANILLILGITSIIYPITCKRVDFLREYSFLFFVTILLVSFTLTGTFVKWHGFVLISTLVIFLIYNYMNAKKSNTQEDDEVEELAKLANKNWCIILTVLSGGLFGVIYGADILVEGAIDLAKLMGISESIIGLTVIAFGTSLPELATTGMAAIRRQNDVALGNIIGSNIWNILCIMGFTSSVVDVEVSNQIINFDIWFMLAATIILLPTMMTGNKLSRKEGIFFLILYIGYITTQVLLNNHAIQI
jgi:cation:H+ antiporter